jgi:hypothetical protein
MDFPDSSLNADAVHLLAAGVERSTTVDKDAVATLWESMLRSFLHVDADVTFLKSSVSAAVSRSTIKPHDIVVTPFGTGVVEDVRTGITEAHSVYDVLLPWSRAVLQGDAVKRAPAEVAPAHPVGAVSHPELPPSTMFCSSVAHVFFKLYHVLTVDVWL